jgi:hypothetical protein
LKLVLNHMFIFEIFWTSIASTMVCPNFKNRPKNGLCPLEVKIRTNLNNFMPTFQKPNIT